MTLAEFREGVQVRVFGQGVIRVDHPLMPGLPVLGLTDTGTPDIDDKTEKCILALFKDFTDFQEWSIL